MDTTLLVLAAGMGSRFGGCKQVEPVGPGGETILEYSIYDARRAGFGEVVFLIRRAIEEDFRSHVLSRLPRDLPYRLAFQELDRLPEGFSVPGPSSRTRPWGTAHAVLCAEDELRLPFAVCNADDFYGRESFALVRDHLAAADRGAADWCMAAFRLSETTSPHGTVSRGICGVDAGGRLASIVERHGIAREGPGFVARLSDGQVLRLTGKELTSMNLWGLDPAYFGPAREAFRAFLDRDASLADSEFYLPALVGELVAGGRARVSVLETPSPWFGITHRDDLPDTRERIAALVASGEYPAPLWSSPPRATALGPSQGERTGGRS